MKNTEKNFKKSHEKMGKYARSKLDQMCNISRHIGVVQNYTDITKRKKVVQLLRDNKKFLQNIFDGIQEGISVLDKDLNIIQTNYWMERMYSSEVPLIGKKCYALYQKRTSPCSLCPSILTLKDDNVHSAILPYPSAENPIKWLEIITYPFKNSDGLTIGVIEYIKDFTEHKHMEENLRKSENRYKKLSHILEKKVEERNRELKESEEKYRFLFENSPYAITLIDLSGKIIDCNPSLERLFNYNKNNLIGKYFKNLSVIPKDFSQMLIEAFNAVIRGKTIESLELQHFLKDRNMIWTKSKASLVKLGDKKLIQVLTEDITERKQIEQELKESEEKYRTLTEQSFMGIAIAQDNKIKYINDTITKISGYTVQELKKFTFEDIKKVIDPDDSNFVLDQFRKKQRGNVNIIKNYQYRLFRKNGDMIWLDSYSKPIIYEDKPADFITVIDITDRKKTERALKESEEKYRNLINNISDVLMEGDIDGTITYLSHKIYDLVGYQSEELIGLKFLEFIHPNDKISYERLNNLFIKAGDKFSVELRMFHKKGYYVPISAKVSLEEINKKLKIFVIIRDITGQRKIDKMMKREIEKLKEIEQIRNNLIRRISHELKTPLISIFSGSQYLLNKYKNQLSDNVQDIVKIIHKGGYRLKNLVDNLLFAYSIESNELILNLKRENLIPIIKNCVNDLIFIANKRKVFINVELIKELYLEIDKFKISNVISNIISNAIKNTPPNGSIYVETFEHQQYIDIIIKDNGVGLKKREIPHLFKKFGKIERYGNNLNIDMEGPGLGLYISNEIVKLHNGEIIIKSKGRGKGSKFTIRLNRN